MGDQQTVKIQPRVRRQCGGGLVLRFKLEDSGNAETRIELLVDGTMSKGNRETWVVLV